MKTNNPFVAGCPDLYVEGPASILWIEFKQLEVIPSFLTLCEGSKPKLTPLQQEWLIRAENNGVTTAVIVGCQQRGIILQGRQQWSNPISREIFLIEALSRGAIAEWIHRKVSYADSRSNPSHSTVDCDLG